MLQRLTGFQPPDETALIGASRLQVTPIRQHLEVMHADITEDTSEFHIHRYTRLLLLLMFGGFLFSNTSGNLVSLRFLYHIERLDDLHHYSWGVAVLGYLYKQMCRASMGTQRDIAGFLPLLQGVAESGHAAGPKYRSAPLAMPHMSGQPWNDHPACNMSYAKRAAAVHVAGDQTGEVLAQWHDARQYRDTSMGRRSST
ncbi:protein MAIN-LIKE 1-like [Nicotiana tomentosiformis]|uniref:protein MAIN-LIKE 1-like n=1 Tax=Nicotiana tomentosiformis TaxID=4098 RepID=UPI00388C8BBF